MVGHVGLIGKTNEEIDKELSIAHTSFVKHLEIVKETIKEVNSSEMVPNLYFNRLQYSLMHSAGYMSKKVDYSDRETIVTFTRTLFPSNDLVGKGKNELEAIVNACDNFVNNPSDYNTSSSKYLDRLRK